jgi:Mrp family chromosome partitioning ATPase
LFVQTSTSDRMSAGTEVPMLLAMLRRRARVLLLGLLLGVLLALLAGSGQERYRGQASLLIPPPGTGNSDANSLERNLNSQISVLRSRETASAVADMLGAGVTPQEVTSATTIDAVPGSDVVQIQTIAQRPALAEGIAASYVDVYLKASAERSRARVAPELERLDTRLSAINQEIAVTNQQLQAALEPFIRRSGAPGASIPDPRTVAPEAAAQQQLLLTEYDRLLGQRQQLEQEQQLQSRPTVLQDATVEDEPVGPDRRQQLLIVLVAGLISVGVALAIDAASGRAVSEQELERALGTPIAARIGADRRLRRSPLPLRHEDWKATEDERILWLRAERLCPSDRTALIIVTGASISTGASTLAQMLALQFAESGHRTVLVDAVGGRRSLTDGLGADQDGGLAALVADPTTPYGVLTPVNDNLDVLGSGPDLAAPSRAGLTQAVHALSSQAEIIIIDAPPALGPAVGVVQSAHAVVLAVDARQAKIRPMEELGLVLSDLRDRLLPVLTQPRTSRRRDPVSPSGRRSTQPVATAR